MRSVLLLGLVGALAADAKPKKPPAPAKPPQSEKPAPAATPAPAAPTPPPAPAIDTTGPSPQLLSRAKELYESLEYDKVIPLTEALLGRDDMTTDQKLEAHRLNGSAKAIVQDPVEAEKPFRLLLRLRPDYDLPKDTPPKILAAFRKVQTEERALAAQADAFQRESVVKSLRLLDEPPAKARGGKPLPFSLRLRDPGANVESVLVPYRRAGQSSFSALALQRDEAGRWAGQIPAEFTADDRGFVLEYYVETADSKGPLLTQGSASAPLRIDIGAGSLQSGKPPPIHRGLFWAGVGVTLASAATASGLALTTLFLQRQHDSLMTPVPGAQLVALDQRGQATALGTNIGWIVTGAFALLTAVMFPFVDWES